MSTERDETYTILVKDKALATVKADLIHAFLSVRFPFLLVFLSHQALILILFYYFIFSLLCFALYQYHNFPSTYLVIFLILLPLPMH